MKKLILTGIWLLCGFLLPAQELEQNVEERLQTFFREYTTHTANIGTCKLDSFRIDFRKKKLLVYTNERFAYQPLRPETVDAIYRHLGQILPGPVNYFDLTVFADGKSIEELIPNLYRKGKKDKARLFSHLEYKGTPWVTRTSRPYDITRGLEGRHIALWQSHGKYYINDKDKWGWQRPRLFCTTEDQFTQSFILPYLLPMLENAGANVFTPRERDTQKQEVIVDNDGSLSGHGGQGSLYLDVKSRKARWEQTFRPGFAQRKRIYQDNENPFLSGTARFAKTEKKKDKAFAEWVPDIPETGEYAVYVSYQTLPGSVSDAKYLVFHNGGVTEFKVNQQIGGGTWVYLGTFTFDKGRNDYGMVVLSNESKEKGVVCADAVRFGGGMGNIARGGQTSGLPRYLEGARYFAQWAGMPYPVYGGYEGKNDMNDDINVRSRTVNYLAGKSLFNPTEEGLGIPFEMSMALHSDAGFSKEDEIIGTLGIYTTNFNNGRLHAGTDRHASRDLSDILLTQLQRDIRSTFNVDWTRRSLWNRNYSETRLPAVPSTIVELLSHQNFADMRLGHDPNFKFTVGRALYKAILQYICSQHGRDYVVQPLPVSHFAIRFGQKKNTLELSWQGEEDPLEPTAKPREYIVYTRIGRGGFDNGVRVSSSSHTVKIEPGIVYSFKVTAVNRGGESFPSEILAAYKAKREKGQILIVNGFDRISAPADFVAPAPADTLLAGFLDDLDHGVPYIKDISYIGKMKEFRRSIPWMDDDASGFGDCYGNYETQVIAGNTFDYPAVHGAAILKAGYSFVSCSDEAVESGQVVLNDYTYTDLILGKECQTKIGRGGIKPLEFKTFSKPMQDCITAYCSQGGNIFISGAYVGTDLWDNRLIPANEEDKKFATEVLKYKWRTGQAATMGKAKCVASPFPSLSGNYTYHNELNSDSYTVESPDAIEPATKEAYTIMRYSENNLSAGIAYQGEYKTCVLGFPFESLRTAEERASLMDAILTFFNNSTKK